MTKNPLYISDRIEILARMLNSRRESEMKPLDGEVWNSLFYYLLPKIVYRKGKVWKKRDLALILSYLNIRASMCLGVFCNIDCERMCRLFDDLADGNMVADDTFNLHLLIYADLENRRGHTSHAIAIYDHVIARTNHGYYKAKALFRKGSIKTDDANNDLPYLQINTLSEALGEAEEYNDKYMVAEIYVDMANMLHRTHPSLAMSFLWKSIVYFEKYGFVTEIRRCKLMMAMVYINMLMQYAGKLKDGKHIRLRNAAKKIVESFKPDMFTSKYDKAHYYYVNAYVKEDEEDMETALNYAIQCGVALQAFDCAIAVAERSLFTDKFKSMQMLRMALSIAQRMGDKNREVWAQQGLKKLGDELEGEKK